MSTASAVEPPSFDLTAKRQAWIAVTFAGVRSTGDELAERVLYTVEVLVDLPDLDEFGRLFVSPLDNEGNPRPKARPEATPERIREWRETIDDTYRAQAIVMDWRKVKSGGRSLAFTSESLVAMMRVPNFAPALFDAYQEAYAGIAETRAGNSESSPADGVASDAADA